MEIHIFQHQNEFFAESEKTHDKIQPKKQPTHFLKIPISVYSHFLTL